jgi:hypothetical protein
MVCRLALGFLPILAACGGRGEGPEDRVRRSLAEQLGAPVAALRCPAGPSPRTCVAEVEDARLELVVRDTPDGLSWSLEGFVIATAPLEEVIAAELETLGVAAAIDCRPRYRLTQVGERVDCRLTLDGEAGAAWALITDEAGRFELELALDPAAVLARTAAADVDQLERLSRALDLDEGAGAGGAEP